MRKKSLILTLILVLTVTMFGSSLAFATSQSDLRNELDEVEEKQDELSKKMAKVSGEIKSAQAKVSNLSYQINETSDDIATTEKRIKKKQKEMQEREKNLNERLVVMYKNGSVGFVDVLMGSNSISEFVSNMEMIQKIYKNDITVLETLQTEHTELVEIQAELKAKKVSLAEQKSQLAVHKAELDAKKKELEKEEDALKDEADRLTAEIVKLMDKNSPYVGGEFEWPVPSSRYITSSYGNRLHPTLKVWKFHTGIDIGASSGKDIIAAASGKVIMSTWYSGYGNFVMIDHGGGIVTCYGHASKLIAKKGDIVKRGQVVAKIGSTGRSTGPHLHFEVRVNGEYQNPMNYY